LETVVGLDVAAQVGLPTSSDSKSESESATDDYCGYSRDHQSECDDLVPVDECSSSESAVSASLSLSSRSQHIVTSI